MQDIDEIAAKSDVIFIALPHGHAMKIGKHVSRLSLEEAAVLAALPYAPSALNPLDHPIECKQRPMLVLNAMAKHGFITQDVADETKAEYVYLSNGRKM